MADAPNDGERRADQKERSGDGQLDDRERIRERRRLYRQDHSDQHPASTRRWKEAHPERVRELNRRWKAENLERSRELNRESMRRTTARKRQLADKRRRVNDASRRWKAAHPDHVRDYHRRWAAANSDKVDEYYRRYRIAHREELNARATAWRDSAPEKMKHARKAWADRNKERTAEIQRKRRSDPDKYRADLDKNAAAARLRKRLVRAGLPPKRVHPSTAGERRANDQTASDYFTDPALPERLRQFTAFTATLTDEVIAHGDRMLEFAEAFVAMRVRIGLPAVDAEQVMYARAAQVVAERVRRVDFLTSREIAAAIRSAKSAAAIVARERRLDEIKAAVKAHIQRHSARLRADADLENAVRARRGAPKLLTDLLVVRCALDEMLETSSSKRGPDGVSQRVANQVERALLPSLARLSPGQPSGRESFGR
ncbi:hypothetical protein SAMN04487846_3339 [Microbacterium sp. cf046]|uniref:hypothetical protein n=1 Tax=Microbacterium sp. cf046 TaxID=1761803 RepID=UPI0008EF3017|nr:hypothetical protein [Microbacterium sp. cf046]SFS16624.1 hypothetical protein SAMN04487846_3339 [Microbacterium sp. cf046]